MRWQGGRESDNVEDRRDDSGGAGGGLGGGGGLGFQLVRGGGVSGIIILAVLAIGLWAIGINPIPILLGDGSISPTVQSQQTTRPAAQQGASSASEDKAGQFARVVLGETEDVWGGIFKSMGRTYQPPTMVLFSGHTSSACGTASTASGPFYCPGDRKVYLDTSFFQEMQRKLGGGGDFAYAYVIAHEVGHHIQNLIGILPRANQLRERSSERDSNAISVRIELQADCFAGVWAHNIEAMGRLDQGDIEEAIRTASAIGDDKLQKAAQGVVVPDSFTHGSSAQRTKWFNTGFQSGSMQSCDTFRNQV